MSVPGGPEPCEPRRPHHGVGLALYRDSCVQVFHTLHPGWQVIEAHVHDMPSLSLFVAGSYIEESELGTRGIAGPAAALHPPAGAHADRIGDCGLETVVVAFDPQWLRAKLGRRMDRSAYCVGGSLGRCASRLARTWLDPGCRSEALVEQTLAFLMALERGEASERAEPAWLTRVRDRLRLTPPQLPATDELAAELRIHPAWLARVYREREGEGLHETVRRRRVEYAAALIRTTPSPLADVAAAAGFCDQSHMNRAFRSVLLRTPGAVQAEVRLLHSLESGPEICARQA